MARRRPSPTGRRPAAAAPGRAWAPSAAQPPHVGGCAAWPWPWWSSRWCGSWAAWPAGPLAHWHWSVLTTYPVGNGGGLLNAIEGTLVHRARGAVLAGIVGMAGGVYLAEYCPASRGQILRGASEVLAGVPSIVLGYVGYVVLVVAVPLGLLALRRPHRAVASSSCPTSRRRPRWPCATCPPPIARGPRPSGMRSGYAAAQARAAPGAARASPPG